MSGTRYHSYILRHWQLSNGQQRVTIQLVSTGEEHHCQTLQEAFEWVLGMQSAPPPPTAVEPQPGANIGAA